MSTPKTKATAQSVAAFIGGQDSLQVRKDCRTLQAIMRRATGAAPKMWGGQMVGFGSYRYTYASGHSGEWFLTGFSPRKGNLAVYIMAGFATSPTLLAKLGPHKTGKSCLYLKSLQAVDCKVLEQLVVASVKAMREKYRA